MKPYFSSLQSALRPRLSRLIVTAALAGALAPQAQAVDLGLILPRPAPLAFSLPGLPACPPPTTPTERALWDSAPAAERPLSCGNAFAGYLRFPHNPAQPTFDRIADEIAGARAEVLISNMAWEDHPASPTHVLLDGVRRLYGKVRANPDAYPQGMQVRLHSGVIPGLNLRPDSMDEPIMLARELTRLGVPLEDPAVGWDLRLAAWPYYPHSHAKFEVIDGRTVSSGGYNVTRWFTGTEETFKLPQNSVLWGGGVVDDRLSLRGPVALIGVWSFGDLWRLSREWRCADPVRAQSCEAIPTRPVTPPDYARLHVPEEGAAGYAFNLYERPSLTGSQGMLLALLRSASGTLDLDQATMSPAARCSFAHRWPVGCGINTWPGYFREVYAALERGVQVRLLLNRADGEVAGNFASAALLLDQARRDGIDDRLSVRWHPDPERSHTKAILVDRARPGAVVVTGSLNLHFSSFGPAPLAEHALATSHPAAVADAAASFERHWAEGVPSPEYPWMAPPRAK